MLLTSPEKQDAPTDPFADMSVRFLLRSEKRKITVTGPTGKVLYTGEKPLFKRTACFSRPGSESGIFEMRAKGWLSSEVLAVDTFAQSVIARFQPKLKGSEYEYIVWDDVDHRLGVVTIVARKAELSAWQEVKRVTGTTGWLDTFKAVQRVSKEQPEILRGVTEKLGDYMELRSDSELLLRMAKNVVLREITVYEPKYARHVPDKIAVPLALYLLSIATMAKSD